MLVGDVHPEVADVAGALTPVPGGVGPLTITMLMMNTLRAARRQGGGSVGAALLPFCRQSFEHLEYLPLRVLERAVRPDRVVGATDFFLG